MGLEAQINQKIKEAMIAKDQASLRGLRAIKSAILLAKTEKGNDHNVSEEKETQILQKLVKQRKDSLEIFREQGRDDLAKTEEEEIEVISAFLPEQMGEEEITTVIQRIIESSGASSPADMGRVMGPAMKEMAGKADGKMISGIVRKLLTGN